MVYDVMVIGGGVVGSAIARELSKYKIHIGVLEKNLDVCYETSGRNSGVIHGGFSYNPNSLKAKLCLEGNLLMDDVCKDLDVPFKRCGKVLVGNTPDDLKQLKKTIKQGIENGVENLSLIDKETLKEIVPEAIGEFAMLSKNSGIIDPFTFNIALAENAARNGVKYFFDNKVSAISRNGDLWEVETTKETFKTKWVINSAGLQAHKISDMLGIKGYTVIGSKGDYIILDKNLGSLLPMPIYPVPSNTYMGIHVTNTTDGNVTVGPNAEEISNFKYYGVSKENIEVLAESALRVWPHIHKKDYIRNYSGILPKWVDKNGTIQDFKIEIKEKIAPNAINLVGIESPGLTASCAIGKHVVSMLKDFEELEVNNKFNPKRKGIKKFASMTLAEKQDAISINPNYGELICRCEEVSKAEILEAINNPLGVSTVVGIKYRTRSMMGRCQGGYCQMRVTELIEEEKGLHKEEIIYNKSGAYLFTDSICKEV